VILQVVDKFLIELQAQLDAKSVALEVSQEARNWLAEQGYDKSMGARPMGRLIQEKVKKELANELLFGSLTAGGAVSVDIKDDKLTFNYASAEQPDVVSTAEE
jgi:ATP-dependent Clp protease ATP-binding subunit ClpA